MPRAMLGINPFCAFFLPAKIYYRVPFLRAAGEAGSRWQTGWSTRAPRTEVPGL